MYTNYDVKGVFVYDFPIAAFFTFMEWIILKVLVSLKKN
jgi:hypothetical protein